MSVFVFPNLVRTESGRVIEIEDPESPKANQIIYLNNLIFLDDLRNSLFAIANDKIDLTFFTKPNASVYGDKENINLSFSPNHVINCINEIKAAFEKNENNFIRPIEYEGVYDKNGTKLHNVFTEDYTKGFLFNKKIYRWGTITTFEGKATLQLFDEITNSWIKRIDLTKEKPNLFYAEIDSENRKHRKDQIEWKLQGKRFYSRIEPELDNLMTLALFARKKGYELQITQS